MSLNTIGNFAFVALSRPPEIEQEQVVTRARPGTDGVMLQRVGRRGRAFQLTSMVDAPTLAGAMQLYYAYTLLVGQDAVEVIWADQFLVGANSKYFVTAVEPINIRRIVRGHGGLNGVSHARCECLWTLQPALF